MCIIIGTKYLKTEYGKKEKNKMKITQYTTSPNLSMSECRVFPSELMTGAVQVRATGKVISDDFLGFGVAITGSSCYLLNQMDKESRRALLEYIYGKDGANLSVGRLTIGSSDYSAELYSYDDVPNDIELRHFSIDRDREYIIPMIKEILEVRPDLYIFAAPWSPPAWMKTGGSLCGGFMREDFLDCYADYLIKFVEEYEKCGIHISALTPQNEPETLQRNKMPACVWSPDTEAKFISILRRKLTEKGMNTEIWMYDYNFNNWHRPMWCLDTHKHLLDECQAIGFHYYTGSIEETAPLHEAYPQMKLHFTEGGPRIYDHYDTDWCKWTGMMAKTLNHHFSSFTGWNLMLDENGNPNIGPHPCGGLVTKNSVDGAISYSGQFKSFMHIAKFMQKGAKALEFDLFEPKHCYSQFYNKQVDLCMTLFENPDGSRVYVFVNGDTDKKQVQFKEDGQLYYVLLMPDSVSTVVVEK